MGQLVRSLAAGRKASVLFRTLKHVKVEYNPYDGKATTAREFVRRVRTSAVEGSNKELKITVNSREEYGSASIGLEYSDGFVQNIECTALKIVDVLDEVERVARWRGPNVVNPFEERRKEREEYLQSLVM